MNRIGMLAVTVGLASLGCKSEAQQYREDFEKELPGIKPQLAALAKISATPVTTPPCDKGPAGPFLLKDSEDLSDALAGKKRTPRIRPLFVPGSEHPCFSLDADDLILLGKPFDEKESHAGQPGPHRSAYTIAVETVRECFAGIQSVVILKQTNYVAPKLAGPGSFIGGTVETDVMVYSPAGEPRCVTHVKTSSKNKENVFGKTDHDAVVSLAGDLDVSHEDDVAAVLGIKRK